MLRIWIGVAIGRAVCWRSRRAVEWQSPSADNAGGALELETGLACEFHQVSSTKLAGLPEV